MNDDDKKIVEKLWSFSCDRRESIFKEFFNQAFRLHADEFIDFTRDGYPRHCFWEQKIELESLGRPSLPGDDSLSSISSSSNDMFTPPVSPLHDEITNSPFPNFDESDQASVASSLRSRKSARSQAVIRNQIERSNQESSQSLQEDEVDQASDQRSSGDEILEETSPSDNCRSEAWDQIESLLKKTEVSSQEPFNILRSTKKFSQVSETLAETSNSNHDAFSAITEEYESVLDGGIPFLTSVQEDLDEARTEDPENLKENPTQKTDECTLSQISEQSLPDVDEPLANPQLNASARKIETHGIDNGLCEGPSQIKISEPVIESISSSSVGTGSTGTTESHSLGVKKKSQQSSKSKKSIECTLNSKKVKNSTTSGEFSSNHPIRTPSQRGEIPCETPELTVAKKPRRKSDHHESDDGNDDCDVDLWDAFDDIETYEGSSQSRKRARHSGSVKSTRKPKTFEEKFFKKYPDAECQIFKHEVKIHVLRSQQWMLESDDPASIIGETYTAMHNNMFRDIVRESALHAHCESYALNSLPPLDEDDDIMEIPIMAHSNINVNRNRILSDSDSDGSDHVINPDDDQPSTSTGRKRTRRVRMSTSKRAKRPRKVSDDSDDKTDDEPWNLPQYSGGDDDDSEEVDEIRGIKEDEEKKINSEPRRRRTVPVSKSFWDQSSSYVETANVMNFMKRYYRRNAAKEKQRRRISGPNDRIGSTDDEVTPSNDNPESENIPPGTNMPVCLPISVTSPLKRRRKNIRGLKGEREITEASREANTREKERMKRVIEISKKLEKCPAASDKTRLILDIDPKTNEPRVEVHPSLVKHLKDHQFKGIQFMYTNTIENIDLLKNDSGGSGCILAHCMGLGKTLQVIAYVHTILSHPLLKNEFRKIMIAAPVNTLKNWNDEFRKWLPNPDTMKIYQMTDLRDNLSRAKTLGKWYDQGGILIIGLPGFTTLLNLKLKTLNTPSSFKNIDVAFVNPGPDILIIDEGHLLKNDKSKVFQAFCQVPTDRKIILTGTPLQNNLEEYYTMIDLVKPRLLGTKKEFGFRFKIPIENGQHADSTKSEVMKMKRMLSVLGKLLTGSVQRFDYEVLKPYLEPKYEYSIFVQATDLMIELYNYYLDNVSTRRNHTLLSDAILLRLVCNHPAILPIRSEKEARYAAAKAEKNKSKNGSLPKNQEIDLTEEPDEDQIIVIRKDLVVGSDENKLSNANGSLDVSTNSTDDNPAEWFRKFMKDGESFRKIELSAKFTLSFFILEQCVLRNEKLVIISQCLETLDLIEEFLASHKKVLNSPSPAKEIEWIKDRNYFRIDGNVQVERRKCYIDTFNNPKNQEARLFLLAVKAGGLGVNLIGANRAIIFDSHWNPMVDMQAIFRIYRLGQTKPSFIYRLITKDTMEEKVYMKQILKTGLSMRVVDKTNIENSVRKADVEEYYSLRPEKRPENGQLPTIPKDDLLGDMILAYKDRIVEYREQDSLLQKKPEEDLDEQERQQAWEEYERERDEEKRRSERAEEEAKRMSELERCLAEESGLQSKEGQPVSSETNSTVEIPPETIQSSPISTINTNSTSNGQPKVVETHSHILGNENNGNDPQTNGTSPQISCGVMPNVLTNISLLAPTSSTSSTSTGTTVQRPSTNKKAKPKKSLPPQAKPNSSVFAENEALRNAFPTRKTYSFEDPSLQRAHVHPESNGSASAVVPPRSSGPINLITGNSQRPRPIRDNVRASLRASLRASQFLRPTILQKTANGHLHVRPNPSPTQNVPISLPAQQNTNLHRNPNSYSHPQYQMTTMSGYVYGQAERVEQPQVTNALPQQSDIPPVVDKEIGELISEYLGDTNLEDMTSLAQKALDPTHSRPNEGTTPTQSYNSPGVSSLPSEMQLYNSNSNLTPSYSSQRLNGQQNLDFSNLLPNQPAASFPAFPSNVQQPTAPPVRESHQNHSIDYGTSFISSDQPSIINDEDLSNGLLQNLSLVDCTLFELCEKLIDSKMRSRALDQEAILKAIQDCLENFINAVRHRKFQASISNSIANLKLASSCDKILKHLDEELPEARISDPTTGANFVLNRDITRGPLNVVALRLVID